MQQGTLRDKEKQRISRRFSQVDWLSTEFCYSPIIQSRSSADGYDLKPTAESSPEDMSHKGVFLVSLGMRYKGYCANLGRTFIVDPDKVGVHISSAVIYGAHLSKGSRVCL